MNSYLSLHSLLPIMKFNNAVCLYVNDCLLWYGPGIGLREAITGRGQLGLPKGQCQGHTLHLAATNILFINWLLSLTLTPEFN